MAKFRNEDLIAIDPLSLVSTRAITFTVYVYLQLNARVIRYQSPGDVLEDVTPIEGMMQKGLKHLFVLKAEMDKYVEWVKGTPYARTPEQLLAQTVQALGPSVATPPQAPAATPVPPPPIVPQPPAANAPPPSPVAPAPVTETPMAQVAREEVEKAAFAAESPDTGKEFVPNPAAEKVMEGLLKPAPENGEAISQAKGMIKDILATSPAGSVVKDIIESSDTEHATCVAIYTTVFALGLGKTDQGLLQDLIMASLLHDVGLTQVPADIVPVPRTKQSEQQKTVFERHVPLGAQLLIELEYPPNKRVLTLLDHHHEKFNGTGYPAKMDSFRIDENAQLIAIADLVDSLCRGNYDGQTRSLNDALIDITKIEKQATFPEYFNPEIFKKIMNWLKKGAGRDYISMAESTVKDAREKMLKAS